MVDQQAMILQKMVFFLCLTLGIFGPTALYAVKPLARGILAQSLTNQRNTFSFPYGTPIEKIGAEVLADVNHIRFMTDTAEDEFAARKSPRYPTVRTLAAALRSNPALVDEIPPILIWQDTWGRLFTLDHRRLLAARLAGISKIHARWATPAEFRQDQFKFTTKTMGKSIELIDSQGQVIDILYSGFVSTTDELLFDRALEFALNAHGDQPYGAVLPYAYHLAAVVSVLRRYGHGEIKYLVAALLHDTIEDTSTTYEEIKREFGLEIANIVFAVTNAQTDAFGRKLAKNNVWQFTFPKIFTTPGATLVKLADRIANTEESVWGPMRGREGKLENYRAKYEEFERSLRIPGQYDEMWTYLRRLTFDAEFAKRHLPSKHQLACEVTLVGI